jgi:putative ABC transport system permease protein
VPERLARIDGVDVVTPFALSVVTIEDQPVNLWAWETDTAAQTADLKPSEGAPNEEMWAELGRGDVAVSGGFAYQHDLDVGDTVEIPSASGTSGHEVVSIIPEYTIEGGVIYTGLETFQELTGDDRYYDVLLNLEPGADRDAVAEQARQELSAYPQLVVWSGGELLDSILGTAEQAFTVLNAVGITCLILALLVGATTSAAAVAARRAPLAISRVIGASNKLTKRQLWLESSVLGLAAWVIALPLGVASIGAIIDVVGAQNGFFPPTVVPTASLLLILPLTVALMAWSVWLPTRSVTRVSPVEVLRDE